jgi:hypothetical protein
VALAVAVGILLLLLAVAAVPVDSELLQVLAYHKEHHIVLQ